MHNYINLQSEQMIINTCKILPFFKISRSHVCKMTHFFAPPIEKKNPLFRENGYERGIRFGREWRGRESGELFKVLFMIGQHWLVQVMASSHYLNQ